MSTGRPSRVFRGEDHPCRAWATGAEAAERARPCRSGVSPSPRRSGRVPVAPRSKPRGTLLVIRLLAGGREAAELPSGQPDLLTPLECLRGRTECPKAGNSRTAVFRGSRPQTQEGSVHGQHPGAGQVARGHRVHKFHAAYRRHSGGAGHPLRASHHRPAICGAYPIRRAVRTGADGYRLDTRGAGRAHMPGARLHAADHAQQPLLRPPRRAAPQGA